MTESEDNVAPELLQASDVLVSAYHGVRVKPGKGVPHARAVASAPRLAGCSAEVQLAGLLHDVVRTLSGLSVTFARASAARLRRSCRR